MQIISLPSCKNSTIGIASFSKYVKGEFKVLLIPIFRNFKYKLYNFWSKYDVHHNFFYILNRNVKIILLPRDPRDVYNSRRKLLWCQQNKDCSDIESFCNVMNSNYKSFKSMVKAFPDQLR